MNYKQAIVRIPGPELIHGLTSAGLGLPDPLLAVRQHREYVQALNKLGLEVLELESDQDYPDGVFVEDTAVLADDSAMITRPGAPTRRGEEIGIEQVLRGRFKSMDRILSPGTLEGGDVLRAGNVFYVGISGRTNEAGANQLVRFLEKHGYEGFPLQMSGMLHLKSGVAYLENNTMLLAEPLFDHPAFESYSRIRVPQDETYAANALWINGTVLLAKGFPRTKRSVQEAGYTILELDVSEFRKVDGGLSCLSLRRCR